MRSSIKILTFALAIMTGFGTLQVSAQETLTVHDRSDGNGFVPVYGSYANDCLKAEFVISGNELAPMTCGTITGLKFYASQPAIASWDNANFQVFLKEVDYVNISVFGGTDNATIVYEGTLSVENNIMSVSFATGYNYTGRNLLVGIYNTNAGSINNVLWYGEYTNVTSSVYGHNATLANITTPSPNDFIPKTTFTYTPSIKDTATICSQQLPYTWRDTMFGIGTVTGDHVFHRQAQDGSDSTVYLHLVVNPSYTGPNAVREFRTICRSDLPYIWNGVRFNIQGSKAVKLTTACGCDSVVVMDLTALRENQIQSGPYENSYFVCNNEFPILVDGIIHDTLGHGFETSINTASGCSFTHRYNILYNDFYSDARIICSDQLPYPWNGKEFYFEGVDRARLTATSGEDSLVRMELYVNSCSYDTLVEIIVVKNWDDRYNNDAFRPDSITVNLLADGDSVATCTITGDDSLSLWTYSFGFRPKKNNNGQIINYTIEEKQIVGYEPPSVQLNTNEQGVYKFITTSIHRLCSLDLDIVIIWDDLQSSLREDLYLQLFHSYNHSDENVFDPVQIGVSGDNNWHARGNVQIIGTDPDIIGSSWHYMPQFYNRKKVRYGVKIIHMPDGYTAFYTHGGELLEKYGNADTIILRLNVTLCSYDTVTICSSNLPYTWRDTTFGIGTVTSDHVFHHQAQDGSDSTVYLHLVVNTCTPPVNTCPDAVDREGNIYPSVRLGSGGKCWTTKNLRSTIYSDGDPIENVMSYHSYEYPNTTGDVDTFGHLYDWYAAVDTGRYGSVDSVVRAYNMGHRIQGICPDGWYLPSDEDYEELNIYPTTDLRSTSHWINGANNTNSTDFNSLPGGKYNCATGRFEEMLGNSYYWSCHPVYDKASGAMIDYICEKIVILSDARCNGYSVRCVYNEPTGTTAALPRVSTNTVSNIADTSATCGGEVTDEGGANVTARGVCWSTSPNPTIADSHTSDGNGTGSFTSNITGLTANTTYYVRAYATNSAGTAYGNEVKFNTVVIDEKSCREAKTVTDHEGNGYATVKIGNQCWMRQNLRTTTSPSTGTYLVTTDDDYTFTGKQARWYDNDSAQYAPRNYGLLYNWNAAVDTFTAPQFGETSVNNDFRNAVSVAFTGHRRGICPEGWHLPSDAEWDTLTNYVGSQSKYICDYNSGNIAKALADTTGWQNYTGSDTCAVGRDRSKNNKTGFSAVPAGYCSGSLFSGAGVGASFWSSTQSGSYVALGRDLDFNSALVYKAYSGKSGGVSVRCVKDNDAVIDEKSCPEAKTVTDVDNNAYATVKIGNQCWMRENLRTKHYANGDSIPAGEGNSSITNPYYYDYTSSGIDLKDRGLLYNWAAVMNGDTSSNAAPSGVRGICPDGWHVPSNAEWDTLTNYVSSQSNYTCDGNSNNIAKALADTTGWNSYNNNNCAVGNTQSNNNKTGFSAVPAGSRSGSSFGGAGVNTSFWSSTQEGYIAWIRGLGFNYASVDRYFSSMNYCYSVRCVRDEATTPTVVIDSLSCPEAKTVTDHEGNVYATVKIGNQCWMRQNLRTKCDAYGTAIPAGGTATSVTHPYYYEYPETETNIDLKDRGLLYNWPAANRICPTGWHLPSDAEWDTLTTYVGSQSEYICNNSRGNIAKALTDTTGWIQNQSFDICAPGNPQYPNNATGFSAVPAGYWRGSSFFGAGAYARFWSSTQDGFFAWGRDLGYRDASVGRSNYAKDFGYSVRCVKDENGSSTAVVIDTNSCPEAKTVTDHEGNAYATVKIGNQCWMRQNLRTTTSPSTGTYLVTTDEEYTYTGKQARWYGKDSAQYAPQNYGLLYNWNAAVDTFNNETGFGETSVNRIASNAVSVTFTGHRRGICPEGWHLPSDAEWDTLTTYVGSQSYYTCDNNSNNIAKALADTTGWNSSNNNCAVGENRSNNNRTGFSVVPAGYRDASWFNLASRQAIFWSSTQSDEITVWGRLLDYDFWEVAKFSRFKNHGHSVRCVKDNDAVIDEKSCREALTVTDVDNNAYATVKIGNQCWMRENLRTTKYANGTAIPAGEGNSLSHKFPYYYNNTSSGIDLNKRGYHYNWLAATRDTSSNSFPSGVQGICPTGWHLPSEAEWDTLTNYVSSIPEYRCNSNISNIAKALADTTGWQNDNTTTCAVGNTKSDNNKTGFSAVPVGYRTTSSFYGNGNGAIFWSSTQSDLDKALCRSLSYISATVTRYDRLKLFGHSVRCVKN